MKEQELPADFFAEFPSVSKAEWLHKIRKDLKDKQLEELRYAAAANLMVEPFAHIDDFSTPPTPLSSAGLTWKICENVAVNEPDEANRQIITALEGGVEAICLRMERMPDLVDLDLILQNVYLDFIGLHLAGAEVAQNPGAVLAALAHIAKSRNLKTASLQGSLAYDPAAAPGLQDWRYAADLMEYGWAHFPGFKMTTLESFETDGIEALADLLDRGNLYFQKLTAKGLSPTIIAAQIQFSIPIGTNYLLEIARLRAFKLLWLNVLKGWQAPLQHPVIAVHFQQDAYTDALYSNMIRATTMAMSAVLGGADRLTIRPYDAGNEAMATYPPAFGRRIARNIQHLLKMESFFEQTNDPVAGSYYIEKLTVQIAEMTWTQFQGRNK